MTETTDQVVERLAIKLLDDLFGGCEYSNNPKQCDKCSPSVAQIEAALREALRIGRERAELDRPSSSKEAFLGYGPEDSDILGCGHSKWACKGDCITCLSYCIDHLNKRLSETTQKLTLAESELLKTPHGAEFAAAFASHARREALREAAERRWTDQDVYDAYLMGCADECLPEPLDKGTFLATLDDIQDVQ